MSKKNQPSAKLQSQVANLRKQLAASQRKQRSAPSASTRTIPASYARTMAGSRPSFSGGRDFMSITHRELVGILDPVTTDWGVQISAKLNPGNSALFPWLSTQAYNWESYSFSSLRFYYSSRSSTQKDGVVQMFADYDVADYEHDINPDIVDESDASNFLGFIETAPYLSASFRCDQKSLMQGKNMRYVVPPQGVPALADPANYYVGAFFVATSGNATSLGSVWVEYTVKLFTPCVTPIASLTEPPNYLSASSTHHLCTNDETGHFNDWFCIEATVDDDVLYRSNVTVEASGANAGGMDTLIITQPGWYSLDWAGEANGQVHFDTGDDIPFTITTVENDMSVTTVENAYGEGFKNAANLSHATWYEYLTRGLNFLVEFNEVVDTVTPYVKMVFGPTTMGFGADDPAELVQWDFLEYSLAFLGAAGVLGSQKKRNRSRDLKPRRLIDSKTPVQRSLTIERTVKKKEDKRETKDGKNGKNPIAERKFSDLPRQAPNWRPGLPRDAHVRAFLEKKGRSISPKRPKTAEVSSASSLRERISEIEVQERERERDELDKQGYVEVEAPVKIHMTGSGTKRKL